MTNYQERDLESFVESYLLENNGLYKEQIEPNKK